MCHEIRFTLLTLRRKRFINYCKRTQQKTQFDNQFNLRFAWCTTTSLNLTIRKNGKIRLVLFHFLVYPYMAIYLWRILIKYSNTVDCVLESTLPISGKLKPFIRHSKAMRILSVKLRLSMILS